MFTIGFRANDLITAIKKKVIEWFKLDNLDPFNDDGPPTS